MGAAPPFQPFKLNDEQQEALDIIVSCGDWFLLKEHIEFLVNQRVDAIRYALAHPEVLEK
jgi:hypothetical protein